MALILKLYSILQNMLDKEIAKQKQAVADQEAQLAATRAQRDMAIKLKGKIS